MSKDFEKDERLDPCQPEAQVEQDEDRDRVQKRRAAIAVAIMAVFTFLVIGGVQFMSFMADKPKESQTEPTVTRDAIIATQSILFDIKDIEPTEPFYVLLIGSDSRKGTALYTGKESSHAQVDQHSDIMTLVRVDPVNYVITLVTIPRDTQLTGSTAKVNDSLLKDDPEAVVKTAERLTGVKIDYYMMVGFTGFEDLVDAMGGINADVPVDISLTDPRTAKKVSIEAEDAKRLSGSEALALARTRKVYEDDYQDAYRQVNVRNLEISMIERASEYYTPDRIGLLLNSLKGNMRTNMDSETFAVLACDFMENYSLITFYSCSGPYEGDYNDKGLWVVPEDKEAWAALMEAVDSGADPATVVKPLSFDD